MKIVVAQTRSVKGGIDANIDAHKTFIDLAGSYKADAIFFPELSITSYELQLATEIATHQDAPEFDDFQQLSNMHKITVGLGMPTRAGLGVRISMIIFQPDRKRQTYSKQQLHADELPYFISGEKQIILTVGNKKIAPAICFESLQVDHADAINKLGAEIYIASVAKSQSGIDKAMVHYPAIAMKFAMPVMMSNCVGYCDNFESVGQSSVWTKKGILAGQLNSKYEGVLVFDTETEEVAEHTI